VKIQTAHGSAARVNKHGQAPDLPLITTIEAINIENLWKFVYTRKVAGDSIVKNQNHLLEK
jgi:hypothetical protein